MTEGEERASPPDAKEPVAGSPGGAATVEEMSEASFPASDPPATWTWDIGKVDAADDLRR